MQLDALVRFAEVVDAGSFSAAARRLGISRQAVQRSIDQLETTHQVQLLERSTRRLRLTDAGRRLLVVARDVRAASQQAAALLRAEPVPAPAPLRGRLHLTAPPLFARAHLAEPTAAFLARWPAVRVEIHTAEAPAPPHPGALPLQIRLGAPPARTYARKLGTARQVLVATPRWRAQAGPLPHPDALLSAPVLTCGPRPAPWRLHSADGTVTLDVETRLQSDSAAVMVCAALRHLGVLCVPRMAVRDHLAAGALVEVLPGWAPADAPIWATCTHRAALDPTLSAFLDALGAAQMGLSADGSPAPRAPRGSPPGPPPRPPGSGASTTP